MEYTWMDVLVKVLDVLVGLLVSVGIPYLMGQIGAKVKSSKAREYLARAQEYLTSAVTMVNQTFVDQLKKDGKFDADAQLEAFEMAADAWLLMMNDEMKAIIIEEVGDFDTYIRTQIEAKVNALK